MIVNEIILRAEVFEDTELFCSPKNYSKRNMKYGQEHRSN